MKRSVWFAFGCLILCLLASGRTALPHSQAQGGDPLVLLDTVEVGGQPESIVVDVYDGRNGVIFWDLSDTKVRFLDGDTLTLATEEISLPSWSFDGWLAYDRYHRHTFVLQVVNHSSWQEVRVHRLGWRSNLGSFSVNAGFNDPAPQDDNYDVDGLAFEQPMSEGNNPGRLIIDNTPAGNIDVADLNAAGTNAALIQRFSYRDAIVGAWQTNNGNSLALETQHETLTVDDLTSVDLLYISDKNHSAGYGLLALQLDHPLLDLNAVPLPEVDLQGAKCGIGGCQGVAMAGSRDILYVATGNQSFETGYVDEVNTTNNQLAQVVNLTYGDLYDVHVDWYDPRRVFVVTIDHYGNHDPDDGLYLHLIYDGVVVDTLRLMIGYENSWESKFRDMTFDPYHRRLYLTVGSSIMVVEVNYGAGVAPTPPSPSVTVSGEIDTWGGSLDAPDGSAELDFAPGVVDETTVVTYTTETASAPTGDLFGVRFFDLSAVALASGTPVTTFNSSYLITINYTDGEKGGAIEDTLGLYWWDGGQWTLEPTSSVDMANNRLTARPDHITLFAVLGETKRVYLPLVMRN